jgi:hypothetical protein
MQSRFVFSPAPEQRDASWRVMGAMLCFVLGAIVSSALYPCPDTDIRGSHAGPIANPTLATSTTDGLSAYSARERAEYIGGPIPEPTFTIQAVVAVGAKETQALLDDDDLSFGANGEKPDHTANKPMRKQEYYHRRTATRHRQYREQPSNFKRG